MSLQKLDLNSSETFETIEVFINGKMYAGLRSDLRVERDTLPEGFYVVGVRESEEDSFYGQLKDYVWVNHIFDIILTEKLELPEFGLYFSEDEVSEDTWDFNITYDELTIKQFLAEQKKIEKKQ